MLSTAQLDLGTQQRGNPDLLQALATPAMYRGHPQVVVHETHASWVFVAGERTYKVKKPVALGFLDYSTLARRRDACREEVRINRELAPDIYLGVRAIVPSRRGFRLAREGAPGALEYAVEMRSFRDADTFAGLIAAGALTCGHVARAARRLADFHRSASVVAGWGPDWILATWHANLGELHGIGHPPEWRVDVARAFADDFVRAHALEIRRRARLGFARDGHGDLRCEHVLAEPTIRIVDRVEFDPELRRIDVACDVAFLAMDLEAQGQRWAARALIAAYREAGMDPGGEQLRSFFAAHWALVRAKVALIAAAGRDEKSGADQLGRARELWSLSEVLCWRARAPVAIVVCGPTASGKSVLAAELSRRSDIPVVASDAVRKRLAGVAVNERARAEHYRPEFTHRTYEELRRDALLALRSHGGVVIDATCRSRRDRAALLGALRGTDARCLVVRCEVPLELALERARRRLHDARRVSDATPQIALEQFRSFEELDELPAASVLRLDTTQSLAEQLAKVARAVDRLGPGKAPREPSMRASPGSAAR